MYKKLLNLVRARTRLAWNISMRLYEEEAQGLDGPEISTKWPAHCHVTHHVHVSSKHCPGTPLPTRSKASDCIRPCNPQSYTSLTNANYRSYYITRRQCQYERRDGHPGAHSSTQGTNKSSAEASTRKFHRMMQFARSSSQSPPVVFKDC
jgi:hypothetical protein